MNLNEMQVKKILKEEFDSRIEFFLNEKMTLSTKYGANIIKDAIGLKVFDKAGFRYTFAGIIKKEDGAEFAKLVLPEEPLGTETGSGKSPLYEDDDFGGVSGFISRKKNGKREIEFDTGLGGEFDNYKDKSMFTVPDKKVSTSKEPKYILVPMGEFEERFSIS